jgi:hypothetical protein
MVPSAIVGSFSEATMRRGARDRRGLRGEEHRRGQEHRAKRCGSTQILSSGTSIAKEHVGTGVGETGGKRLADAMIKGLNRHPKPIQWTYTKTKLLAKFGALQPVELAA